MQEVNGTIFNDANKEITDDLKNELRLQGHFLTGALENSIGLLGRSVDRYSCR